MKNIFLFLILLFSAATVQAAPIIGYADGVSGSDSNACTTIGAACATLSGALAKMKAANAGSFSCPDCILYVRAGSYDTAGFVGAASVPTLLSGTSWAHPFLIRAYKNGGGSCETSPPTMGGSSCEIVQFKRPLIPGSKSPSQMQSVGGPQCGGVACVGAPTPGECSVYTGKAWPDPCWSGSPGGGYLWLFFDRSGQVRTQGIIETYEYYNSGSSVKYIWFDGIINDAEGWNIANIRSTQHEDHTLTARYLKFSNGVFKNSTASAVAQPGIANGNDANGCTKEFLLTAPFDGTCHLGENVSSDFVFENFRVTQVGIPFDTLCNDGVNNSGCSGLAREMEFAKYLHGVYGHSGGFDLTRVEIDHAAGFGLAPDGNDNFVRQSYFHDNNGGIQAGHYNFLVENSVFYNNGNADFQMLGMGGKTVDTTIRSVPSCLYGDTLCSANVIRNNTFIRGPRGAYNLAIQLSAGTYGGLIQNNIIFGYGRGIEGQPCGILGSGPYTCAYTNRYTIQSNIVVATTPFNITGTDYNGVANSDPVVKPKCNSGSLTLTGCNNTTTYTLGQIFTSGTPSSPNYSLLSSGPAVDTGFNNAMDSDFLNNARPFNSSYDIGAYEYCTSCTSAPTTAVVTIQSSTPPSGALISWTGGSNCSAASPQSTTIVLTCDRGSTLTFTAPATAGGNAFSNWSGCQTPSGSTCSMVLTSNTLITANFGTTRVLTIQSTVITSKVAFTCTADRTGATTGTTPTTRTYDIGASVSCTADGNLNDSYFSTWTGADSTSGFGGVTASIAMSDNKTVTINMGGDGCGIDKTNVTVGRTVTLCATTTVRDAANGNSIGSHPLGDTGTVIGGPTSAGGVFWSQTQFASAPGNTGAGGWTTRRNLIPGTAQQAPPPPPDDGRSIAAGCEGDPTGSAVGFMRVHKNPITNEIIAFNRGAQPQGDNSVMGFDPTRPCGSRFRYLKTHTAPGQTCPAPGAGGYLQARDNYESFLIPDVPGSGTAGAPGPELWVWGGSHLETFSSPCRSGRFNLTTNTWTHLSTTDSGAFGAVLTGTMGFVIDSGAAWSNSKHMGIIFGGSDGGSGTDAMRIFERTPSGPTAYSVSAFNGTRPPARAQCMNCMVAVGDDFYLVGGLANIVNGQYVFRNDLWQFNSTARTWKQLPDMPAGAVGYEHTVTYDSVKKEIVVWNEFTIHAFNLITQKWIDQTPTGIVCRFNGMGDYLATTQKHYFWSAYVCPDPPGGSQSSIIYEVTTGQTVTPRVWYRRPYDTPFAPANGGIGGADKGSKHERLIAGNGKIYFLGGDYAGAVDQGWMDLYEYDAVLHQWRLMVDQCGVQGEVRPGRIDEAGWSFDSTRNKLWVMPGFYFTTQSGPGPCGGFGDTGVAWNIASPLVINNAYAIYFVYNHDNSARFVEGTHYTKQLNTPSANQITLTNISLPAGDIRVHAQQVGKAIQYGGIMTFDIATNVWEVPSVTAEPLVPTDQQHSKNACYDSTTDSIWRAAQDSRGILWQKYSIAANIWDTYLTPYTSNNEYINYIDPGFEYIACDIVGRKIYLIDPIQYKLIEFDMTAHTVRFRAAIPEPDPARVALSRNITFTFKDFTIPVWDSVNNKLLYPYLNCFACSTAASSVIKLLIYDPATDSWQSDAMTHADNQVVKGASAVFDPANNILMTFGGLAPDSGYLTDTNGFDVWRYGTNTIASLNVSSNYTDTPIHVTPLDNNSSGDGNTPFSRFYTGANATHVSMVAPSTTIDPATKSSVPFLDWSGPCDAIRSTVVTGDTCDVVLTSSKSFNATYQAPIATTYTLTITSTIPGIAMDVNIVSNENSSTCQTPCQLTYANGVVVEVTAPLTFGAASYTLWSGGATLIGRATRVTMNADKTVDAKYVSGNTYTFLNDFSNVQSQRGFTYTNGSGQAFAFANGRWSGAEASQVIFAPVIHPGTTQPSVLTWTAPSTGIWHFTGNLRDGDTGGGDGVDVLIKKNASTVLLGTTTIANGDTTGVNFNITASLVAGETVSVVVSPKGNNQNDTTVLDPFVIEPVSQVIKFGSGATFKANSKITANQ